MQIRQLLFKCSKVVAVKLLVDCFNRRFGACDVLPVGRVLRFDALQVLSCGACLDFDLFIVQPHGGKLLRLLCVRFVVFRALALQLIAEGLVLCLQLAARDRASQTERAG